MHANILSCNLSTLDNAFCHPVLVQQGDSSFVKLGRDESAALLTFHGWPVSYTFDQS